MPGSQLPHRTATLARAQVDTCASTHLPQQQHHQHRQRWQHSLLSSVIPLSHADHQRPPLPNVNATTAALPDSLMYSRTHPSSPSPHNLYTSAASTGKMSNDGPHAANAGVKRSQGRQSLSALDTSGRSASGSFDRKKSLSGSMLRQVQSSPRAPSLIPPSQEPPRSPCVPSQSVKPRAPSQAGRPYPQMPVSYAGSQSPVTVPSQPAQPTTPTARARDVLLSPALSQAQSEIGNPPRSSPPFKHSSSRSPRPLPGAGKCSVPGQAVQTLEHTNLGHAGKQQPKGMLFKAQQNSPSQPRPRYLSHVNVTEHAPRSQVFSQGQMGPWLEPDIREAARSVEHQISSHAPPRVHPMANSSLQGQTVQPVTTPSQSPRHSRTIAQTQAQAQPIPPGTVSGSQKISGVQPNTEIAAHPQLQRNAPNYPPGSLLSTVENFEYESLMTGNRAFRPVEVVSCIEYSGEKLEALIVEQVEKRSLPLVISDLHKTQAWASWSHLFDPQGFQQRFPLNSAAGNPARDMIDCDSHSTTLDFLTHRDESGDHLTEQKAKVSRHDLQCPMDWATAIASLVHPRLVQHGEQDVSASLLPGARVDTRRCQYGLEGTCTPLHREPCSSLGQNLMVWCASNASATWVITDAEESDATEQYVATKLGDVGARGFVLHPKDLLEAPFSSFCYQQKLGDLVLVPSRASCMVVNAGGPNMKVAWSRMTVDTVTTALFTDLPLYQRVCRKESYHIKPTIEGTLIKLTKQLEATFEAAAEVPPSVLGDLCRLLKLYDAILCDEYIPEWRQIQKEGGHTSYVECDFCGANVLGAYFECWAGETLCTLCYCQGRLCGCPDAITKLHPRQHRRTFGERLSIRNRTAQTLLRANPALGSPLEVASDSETDEALEQATLLPIAILDEAEVEKRTWPFSFKAAYRMYKIRQTPGWREDVAPCRICKALLDASQRYYCRPCKHSYCHGCFVHKLYIHPVHTLATDDWVQLHRYHKKNSTLDYKEWKQDPLEFNHEARAHFALMEAARTRLKCSPLNTKCRIGFLDTSVEHPHGLSGTLGLSRASKAQIDKSKSAPAQSVSLPTPISRKRRKDLVQTPFSATPEAATSKRARLSATSRPKDTDQDDAPSQLQSEEVQFAPMVAATSQLQTCVMSTSTAAALAVPSEMDEGPFSVPTVANGIRKFILRGGTMPVMSPVLTSSPHVSSPSTSSSMPTPFASAKRSGSQRLTGPLSETTSALSSPAVADHRMAATVPPGSSFTAHVANPTSLGPDRDSAQTSPATPPSLLGVQNTPLQHNSGARTTSVNVAISTAPPQSIIASLPATSDDLAAPSTVMTAAVRTTTSSDSSFSKDRPPSSAASEPVALASHTSVATDEPAPSFTSTASTRPNAVKPVTAAVPVSQADFASPMVAAKENRASRPHDESLAMATKAIVAGMAGVTPAPDTAVSATAAPEANTAGLASLDNINLRVVTEVLRIFSQANQRTLVAQAEENERTQAKRFDELEKAHAREVAELQKAMQDMLAAQAETHRKAQDRLEAKLLQRLDQQSSIQLQKIQSLEDRLQNMQAGFNLLTEDLDRGAQIELEAMLSTQSSRPVGSDQTSPGADFASTSQLRHQA